MELKSIHSSETHSRRLWKSPFFSTAAASVSDLTKAKPLKLAELKPPSYDRRAMNINLGVKRNEYASSDIFVRFFLVFEVKDTDIGLESLFSFLFPFLLWI